MKSYVKNVDEEEDMFCYLIITWTRRLAMAAAAKKSRLKLFFHRIILEMSEGIYDFGQIKFVGRMGKLKGEDGGRKRSFWGKMSF